MAEDAAAAATRECNPVVLYRDSRLSIIESIREYLGSIIGLCTLPFWWNPTRLDVKTRGDMCGMEFGYSAKDGSFLYPQRTMIMERLMGFSTAIPHTKDCDTVFAGIMSEAFDLWGLYGPSGGYIRRHPECATDIQNLTEWASCMRDGGQGWCKVYYVNAQRATEPSTTGSAMIKVQDEPNVIRTPPTDLPRGEDRNFVVDLRTFLSRVPTSQTALQIFILDFAESADWVVEFAAMPAKDYYYEFNVALVGIDKHNAIHHAVHAPYLTPPRMTVSADMSLPEMFAKANERKFVEKYKCDLERIAKTDYDLFLAKKHHYAWSPPSADSILAKRLLASIET